MNDKEKLEEIQRIIDEDLYGDYENIWKGYENLNTTPTQPEKTPKNPGENLPKLSKTYAV